MDDRSVRFATAADIVRSHQKDEYYEKMFMDLMRDALEAVAGPRKARLYAPRTDNLSSLMYYTLTILVGSKTLGEEYTDIFRVAQLGANQICLFGPVRRALLLLIKACEPLYKTQAKYVLKDRLSEIVVEILQEIPAIHLALFYLFEKYYRISERLVGLRYLSVKREQPSTAGYEVLGGIIATRLLVSLGAKIKHVIFSGQQSASQSPGRLPAAPSGAINLSDPSVLSHIFTDDTSRKCTLCLSYLVDPSVALCGHVFCWSCITEWCQERPECPLCRQTTREQNILPIKS
ncbi:hypothetical protein CANCADRAFT_128784 [Tortispora caseinolytica NRRL Y-17796]|uniref:RING-type E3 ubiquitin transferase n=1 Tax=Tortispora caseinolytica NRRL Y-17796 TaxID=767744 RepID=A0A1E4TAK9_9ASCO|nr:hypothetical protein CANCADRAFT_128784 [Tortispora caseinolytica NRRL Y-17796]